MSKRARLFVLPSEWLVIEKLFQSTADSIVGGLSVPRVGLANGALRQLEKDVAAISMISEGEACNSVAEVVDHLVDGNIFSRVGERKDKEPIGILQPNCLLSELTVVQVQRRETKVVPKSVFKKLRAFWQAKTSVENLSSSLRDMKYATTAAECSRWVKRLRLLELFVNMGTTKDPVWVRTLPGFERYAYQIVEDDTRHSYLKGEKSRSKKRRGQGDAAKNAAVAAPVAAASGEIEVPPVKEAQLLSTDSIVAFLKQRLLALEEEEKAVCAACDEFKKRKLKIDDLLLIGRELDAETVSAYNEAKRLLDKSQMSEGRRQARMDAYRKVLADLDRWVSTDVPPVRVSPRIIITPGEMREIAATDKFRFLSGAEKIAVIAVSSPFVETGFSSSQMIHYTIEMGMKFWGHRDFHGFLAGACRPGKKRVAFFVRTVIPFDGRDQAKKNCGRKVMFFYQLIDAGQEFVRQFLESLNK